MNRLLRLLLAIFALTSMSALANSINLNYNNLNVNFSISANDGLGDNLGGQIFGPGVNLFAAGGTATGWFDSGGITYAPGSTGGGNTTIFFDAAYGKIGSLTYQYDNSNIYAASFSTGSFTFPTNGQNFTGTQAAYLGPVSGVICPTTCDSFTLQTRPGTLTLTFLYSPYNQSYYAASGSFTAVAAVPEPSTLGLTGIGIGALICCKWRQGWLPRPSV